MFALNIWVGKIASPPPFIFSIYTIVLIDGNCKIFPSNADTQNNLSAIKLSRDNYEH